MYEHPANIYVHLTEKEWFITNPVFKTADITSTETVDYLKGSGEIDAPVAEQLLIQGYLTEAPVSLPDVYKTLSPESGPLSFSIALTSACNLQCVYCFQEEKKKAVLDTEKIEKLRECIDVLKRKFLVFSPTQMSWEITGGEPLLPQNCEVLLELLDAIGESVSITTNGTHVAEFADLLSHYRVRLRITIDGTPSVHDVRRKTPSGEGTYTNIVKGIKEARLVGIPILIKVNIDPGNRNVLHRLVENFKMYGWTEDKGITLALSRVRPTPSYTSVLTAAEFVEYLCPFLEKYNFQEYFEVFFPGSEYFEDILSGKKPKTSIHRCRLDRTFYFSPDGFIYPCIRMMSQPVGRFFPEFFIDDTKVDELMSRTITRMPACRQCRYALFCRGGCPAESIGKGSLFSNVCEDYPRILNTYIPYRFKMRDFSSR